MTEELLTDALRLLKQYQGMVPNFNDVNAQVERLEAKLAECGE